MNRGPAALRNIPIASLLALAAVSQLCNSLKADEAVVTVLADFEDDSVGPSIGAVKNVALADCSVRFEANPARGLRSLGITLAATAANATAVCDLRYRIATPFPQADRAATYGWVNEGSAQIFFRLRDARGRIFETKPVMLEQKRRWSRLAVDLAPAALTKIRDAAPDAEPRPAAETSLAPVWPVEFEGYRVLTPRPGRQTVYLDDLEIELRVPPPDMVSGRFLCKEATHLYSPGPAEAALLIENLSRGKALQLSIQLAWLRADGSELSTARASLNLPASGLEFRSRQAVDFSQKVDEPGLYRLVARVSQSGWPAQATFETTIAVTPSNRALPRGRNVFFGLRTNLLREPLDDQYLEIDVAHQLGVQLLGLEVHWRRLEPRAETFDFASLDPLVEAMVKRDMAVLLILTEPPDWLPPGDPPLDRQLATIEALAKRYGAKVRFFQLLETPEAPPFTDAPLKAIEAAQARIAALSAGPTLLPAPLILTSTDGKVHELPQGVFASESPFVIETSGDAAAARAALDALTAAKNVTWQRTQWWYHRTGPSADAGFLYDAIAVLRHYVRAAALGVGGVIWYDLRDDTSDPRDLDQMRGLMRRDFSPKTPLLGFANAVGMLSGLIYAGPLIEAPPQYETAAFRAGPRQVVVLFPKPNRILPAVLAPVQGVEGELSVLDFARRPLTTLDAGAGAFVPPPSDRPLFLALTCAHAQETVQVGLLRPWIRAPQRALVGRSGSFTVEIDALRELDPRYVQFVLPPKAPVMTSLSARDLRAEIGKTVTLPIELTRATDEPFPPTLGTIRVGLEGRVVEVPVEIRSQAEIRPLASADELTSAAHEVGRLRAHAAEDSSPGLRLFGGYQAGVLHLALQLPNDPPPAAEVRLGIAAENADQHFEVRATGLLAEPKLTALFGTSQQAVETWQVAKLTDKAAGRLCCHVQIPAAALSLANLQPGQRLLLAARYSVPDKPATTLVWGEGLDGRRTSDGFEWASLEREK